MKLLSATLLVLFSSLAAAAPTSELPKAPLDVQLALKGTGVEASVTNTGQTSLDVISIHTPLSANDLGGYVVTANGARVPYVGPLGIYLTDNLIAFHQTIAPKQSISTFYDLSDFDFANFTGPYQVSTSGLFQYLPTGASADVEYDLGEYESNVVTFDQAPKRSTKRDERLAGRVFTEECGTSQGNTINLAGSDFADLTNAAVTALNAYQDSAFGEFFGKSSASQKATVTSRFRQLQAQNSVVNVYEAQPDLWEFSCLDAAGQCKSNPNLGAYVQTPQRNIVTLCPSFFGSRQIALYKMCTSNTYRPKNDGYYYRGATLLHELMHVNSVMGYSPIDDQYLNGAKAYGYSAAKKLATSSPAKARINPDNYKYYAEIQYARKRRMSCSSTES